MNKTVFFKKIPLLSGLPAKELDTLAATLQVVLLQPGEVLFRENEPGDSLYIVLEGQLEVLLGIDTKDEKRMATMGPGEYLGEMSLLIPERARTASVRAVEEARLWRMTRSDFEALMLRQPKLAYFMVRTLTKRLDASNRSAFLDLQEKNRQLQSAYDELKTAQAKVVEKERLDRELQVAAEIQVSILPQELPHFSGYDFGAIMRPARMVGGDFYDIFQTEEDRIGIVIGDVTDKGVPSAIFMARTHALIMSEASHGGTPGDILRRTNHHLIHLAQSDQFVTVLLGVLDCASGRIDFARAGHEYPLLVTANGKILSFPQAVGQPVGIMDDFLLDENSLVLPPGGSLLLFTDGVTDMRKPQGEAFGHVRLQRALAKYRQKSGQYICENILGILQKFQSDAPQDDDITLVVVHRS
jgi:sigma-B regulation protein RsbU (phosphoserine phosphatase)